MIAVIDYGIGNVCSIANMIKKIGIDVIMASKADEIARADKLILPGVGSFDAGMSKLNESGLTKAITDFTLVKKKPLLGICLGMQMLGEQSEEGIEKGLNFIPFKTKKFSFSGKKELKIPHMGWDIVKIDLLNDPLTYQLEPLQRYYFVHSYHAVCENPENILMTCDYGYPFTAAVKNENIYGVQFHPEKSHKYGMALLDNFVRRV